MKTQKKEEEKRQGQSLEQSTNLARAGKVGKKEEVHNKTSQCLKRLSPEPRPSTLSAVDPTSVATARKIKFFNVKETVEESSDEDSEPGLSKKPKTKVAEEQEEFEDVQHSDMTIVDLSCLQLLFTASGVLCPLCEQSVSIISFLLSFCVYWVGRDGRGVSVFHSLGVSVYLCLGACQFFSHVLGFFWFFWGGGCTCVRAYMHVCVSDCVRHIFIDSVQL